MKVSMLTLQPTSDGTAFKNEKKYQVGNAKFKCSKCSKDGNATPSKNEVGGGIGHYTGEISWEATCSNESKKETKNYDFWVFKVKEFPDTCISKSNRKPKDGLLQVIGISTISCIGKLDLENTPFDKTGLFWQIGTEEKKSLTTSTLVNGELILPRLYLENIDPKRYNIEFSGNSFVVEAFPKNKEIISLNLKKVIEQKDKIKAFFDKIVSNKNFTVECDGNAKISYANHWEEKANSNTVAHCWDLKFSASPLISISLPDIPLGPSFTAPKLVTDFIGEFKAGFFIKMMGSISPDVSMNKNVDGKITVKGDIVGNIDGEITFKLDAGKELDDKKFLSINAGASTGISLNGSVGVADTTVTFASSTTFDGASCHFKAEIFYGWVEYDKTFDLFDSSEIASINIPFDLSKL